MFTPTKPAAKPLLSGLSPSPNVAAAAKGQQMQGQAALGMERAQQQQESALNSAQGEVQRRAQSSRNAASRFGNEMQEGIANAQQDTRRNVFDVGMGFDYAALQRRNQLNLRQSLLNGIARDF